MNRNVSTGSGARNAETAVGKWGTAVVRVDKVQDQ
jgi:hypothetical protein